MGTWKELFPKENKYFETENGILYNGDCLEIMKEFPENIFDAIITDPPYGTTACKWDSVIPFNKMWEQLKRIRKDNTPIVLFGSEPFSSNLRVSNINEFRYDWIWVKNNHANFLSAKYQPLKRHEIISVFSKNTPNYYPTLKKIFTKSKSDSRKGDSLYSELELFKTEKEYIKQFSGYPTSVLKYSRPTKPVHPTQKPIALMRFLIKIYTLENDLILDFTAGSGSTLVAAEILNRRWVGIELSEKYCEIIKERILNASSNLKLTSFFNTSK